MSRVFWVGVGFVAGVVVARKVNEVTRRATPAGIAENIGVAIREMAGSLGAFGAEIRAGMVKRDNELADVVYINPRSSARARRADG